MAGRSGAPGRSVTSRALGTPRRLRQHQSPAVPVRDRRALGHAADDRPPAARRADRLGRAGPAHRRPLRDRPQALGPRPAGAGAAGAAPGGRAVPARRAHDDPGHRAPRRPGGAVRALRRADLRPRVGARGQPGRQPAAAARDRRRQGAARGGTGRRGGAGAALADPADPAHRRRPGPAAPRARRGPPPPLRPDVGGDVARGGVAGRAGAGRAAAPGRSSWPRSASSSRRTAGTSPGWCRCWRWPPAASGGNSPAPATSADRKASVPPGPRPPATLAACAPR